MRNAQPWPRALGEGVRLRHLAIEYAELLLRQRAPLDAVDMEHHGVRSETRPDRRRGVVARPLDKLGQRRPVGLVLEICGTRLRAGHHQAVEMAVPQFGNIAISRSYFLPAAIAAGDIRQRIEPQAHDAVSRRGADEFDELAFRRFERGIGHVVDEPDLDAVAAAQFDGGGIGRFRVKKKRHLAWRSRLIRRR
jgi:hypothetical protein